MDTGTNDSLASLNPDGSTKTQSDLTMEWIATEDAKERAEVPA